MKSNIEEVTCESEGIIMAVVESQGLLPSNYWGIQKNEENGKPCPHLLLK